jgi:hypothetical protein
MMMEQRERHAIGERSPNGELHRFVLHTSLRCIPMWSALDYEGEREAQRQ